MNTKQPSTGSSRNSPVALSSLRTTSSADSPSKPSTFWFIRKLIFGFAVASATMKGSAWKWSNSWITVIRDAYWLSETASSSAEFPPPTIAMGRPVKKSPSQVAQ